MSEQVNKYLNGKIYMIKSENSEKIYIGSTTRPLTERLKSHEIHFKMYKNGKYNYVTSFKILELGDYYILLLENVKVETKTELERIEGNYIKKYQNVNKHVPGRTKKEWRTDNKLIIKEKKKEYYEDNKMIINENCRKYNIIHNEEQKKKKRDNYDKNKDEINKKKKEKLHCVCGSEYRKADKARHFKSTKHQQYEQNKTINI